MEQVDDVTRKGLQEEGEEDEDEDAGGVEGWGEEVVV